MSTVTTAPGKLMLFGEHAVLHDYPCIVTAVDQYMHATAEVIDEPILRLTAQDVEIENYEKPLDELGSGDVPKGARFVEHALRNVFFDTPACRPEWPKRSGGCIEGHKLATQNDMLYGVSITFTSDFTSTFGFGSSSASTVCTVKALNELWNLHLDNRQIFDIALQTVLDVQGKGSGFDIAAAVFGGTLLYRGRGEVIEPIPTPDFLTQAFVIAYSGTKADTVSIIDHVNERAAKEPDTIADLYEKMGELTKDAHQTMLVGDGEHLGQLMNIAQHYLQELGVSTDKLDAMCTAALDAGAWGSKLSGAGGGDCMIAIGPQEKIEEIKSAIEMAGGQIIDAYTNTTSTKND